MEKKKGAQKTGEQRNTVRIKKYIYIESIQKNPSELKTKITRMKNTLDGINRLGNIEEQVSNLEDRSVEIIQSEQQK